THRRRPALDQVSDRLGLNQVDLTVEIRSTRELTGQRVTRASRAQRVQEQSRRQLTPVTAELDGILAGETRRRDEACAERPVDRLAGRRMDQREEYLATFGRERAPQRRDEAEQQVTRAR